MPQRREMYWMSERLSATAPCASRITGQTILINGGHISYLREE